MSIGYSGPKNLLQELRGSDEEGYDGDYNCDQRGVVLFG